MRNLWLTALWLFSLPLMAQEPSLEEINAIEEEVLEEPAPQIETQPAPAVQNADRPASDSGVMEVIDIKSTIKKVSEPNLFAGTPPNPGSLRSLAGGEAPEEYIVQEGDNLHDICDQLIDEAKYWPKLWAFNPGINNPHFVYPGMRLRFYSGDTETPPFLQVVTEDDVLPVAKGTIKENELVREDISGMLMRSEQTEITPILDAKDLGRIPGIDGQFIDASGTFRPTGLPVIIPAFVVEDAFDVIGKVVAGSAGSSLVDKGEDVIIEDKSGLAVGTNYSVVRPSGSIEGGLRYEFVAQIKINTQDKDDDDIYKGRVFFNRLGVKPGDEVVAYRSVKRTVPLRINPEGKGLEQKVVGFTENSRVIGGRGDFVFLDQAEGPLKEQETYAISQNLKVVSSSFLRDKLPNTDRHVAYVYILDATGSAALGYLVNDAFEVRLGDRITR